MRVVLRSKPTNVFLAKFWGPLLCAGGPLLVFGEDFLTWQFLLAFPFLMGALFGASLAILEVRGGVLRYRRLLRWTTIPEDEIVGARVEWPPVLGSIRLKRFLFPWGRLYFVLDASSDPKPFRKGEYPLLRHIRKEFIHEDQDSANMDPS